MSRRGAQGQRARSEEGTEVLHLRSSDGTKIGYERLGVGPALLILGGSLADHHFYVPLAHELARDFTVYNVDRRGRGGSSDTPPYDVGREVDDVAAVIAEAGGRVHVYGHSAGSALGLRAAAAGVGIARLVLADPPFTPPGRDEAAARAEHAEQTQRIEQFNAAGDYRASVKFFLSGYGLPDDALEEMLSSPAGESMIAAARVLPYDYAMLGDGIVPADLAANIMVPTLILAAKDQPSTARALREALPRGELLLARASMHELEPSEIAGLVTPSCVGDEHLLPNSVNPPKEDWRSSCRRWVRDESRCPHRRPRRQAAGTWALRAARQTAWA